MKRIACIRWKSGDCRLPIDKLRAALMELCRHYSPLVGWEPTDNTSALLDITGLAHLFGGEAAWAEQVLSDLAQLKLTGRVAIAETIGAAWAAQSVAFRSAKVAKTSRNFRGAKGDNPGTRTSSSAFYIIPSGKAAAFLGPLPVAALRVSEETIRLLGELGLTRIDQLEALPREELSSRFGPMLLCRMDQAFGRLDEPVPACFIPPTFDAHWSTEYPTDRREMIEAAIEHLVGRVVMMLTHCNRGAMRLECRLDCQQAISIGLFQPTAEMKRLFELVQLQLERLRMPSPVMNIYVAATLTAPLTSRRQAMLFDVSDDRQPSRELAMLVERLGSRLGTEAVVGVRLRAEAQPELSWRYQRLLGNVRRQRAGTAKDRGINKCRLSLRESCGFRGAKGNKGTVPDLPPRPLRLLPQPALLVATSISHDGPPLRFQFAGQEHHIAHTWGPERIETGWWRGRAVGRDYFRAQTTTGRRFWLFRRLSDGKWFLHGMFE
jgi:protein ImuB